MLRLGRILASLSGNRWSAFVVERGRDWNGRYSSPEALRQLCSIVPEKVVVNLLDLVDANGQPVKQEHLKPEELRGKATLNQVGWIEKMRYDASAEAVIGELVLLDTDHANRIRRHLESAEAAGGLDTIGLSIDSDALVEKDSGRILEFYELYSVDIVTHPAAGGRIGHRIAASRRVTQTPARRPPMLKWFDRLKARCPKLVEGLTHADKDRVIASRIAERMRVKEMEGEAESILGFLMTDLANIEKMDKGELIEKLENVIKFLKSQDGEAAPAGGDAGGDAEPQKVAASRRNGNTPPAPPEREPAPILSLDEERKRIAASRTESEQLLLEQKLERSERWLRKACEDRKLTQKATARVLASCKDRVLASREEADTLAKEMQELLDDHIEAHADARVTIVRESMDNAREILAHMLAPGSIPAPKCGIDDIGYSLNRFDRKFFGLDSGLIGPSAAQRKRVLESIDDGTYDQVYADALRRAFIALYARDPQLMDWKKLVRVQSTPDFRTEHVIRDGWYGFLPDVGEKDPYPTLATPTDTEETGALKKTGGVESYSIEKRANDDIGAIQRILGKLAWSAAETIYNHVFSQLRVATMLTLSDGKKLFDATRTDVNGGTLPITADDTGRANFITARNMMRAITGGSGQKKGIRPRYIILPIEKEGAYEFIRQALQGGNTGLDVPGYLERRGSAMPEPITDIMTSNATDWMLLADPMVAEVLRMLFWQGRQDPELFISDDDRFAALFLRDVIELKIRHVYKCFPVDYVGIVGEDSAT